jgi:cytoskeletal protein RodZ
MTARHQIRIGNRRLGRDRAAIDATPPPRVGEQLQLARERKGVDLFRAERDTKIRLRYLSALEDSDYDELPAAVYTKGFLRNYAIYLGLDPDELLERWREEMDSVRATEQVLVAPPPMPIAAPGRHITLTPGMLVAGLVGLVVLAFVGYLGIQLMRYAETTPIGLTNPANVVSQVDTESIVLSGTAGAGALIVIEAPGGQSYNTTADEHGSWSREVSLSRGRNDFTVTATDPVTQRRSSPLAFTINVPLPQPTASPGASPTPAPPVVLSLNLLGPAEGETSADGHVIVRGTTTGERITIATTYLGTPESTPGPPGPTPTPLELNTPSPAPGTTPAPSGSPLPIGPARDITIGPDGNFAEQLDFQPGRWQVTVTTYSSGLTPIVQTRHIVVARPVVTGLQLVVQIAANSWVRIVADGVRVPNYGGVTLHAGDSATATATSQICLRSGNAGALHVFVNGNDLGPLGTNGQIGSWIITTDQPHPEPTSTPC